MRQDRNKESSNGLVLAAIADVQDDALRFLKRRLGNVEDAEDVLHDFVIKVMTRCEDVREVEKLRSWMQRVLQTTLIDHFRSHSKRQRSEALFALQERTDEAGPFADDSNDLVCRCLRKLLPDLKPAYAEILQRADLNGESRQSVAAALGVSETNLRVRLHRARQALRQRLETTCGACSTRGYDDCDDACLTEPHKVDPRHPTDLHNCNGAEITPSMGSYR